MIWIFIIQSIDLKYERKIPNNQKKCPRKIQYKVEEIAY